MNSLCKWLRAPIIAFSDIARLFIIYLPGELGFRLRQIYYKSRFKSMGKNVRIDVGVHITGLELISVGDNVYIDKYCIISTGVKLIGRVYEKPNTNFHSLRGEISIGNNIHICQFCILMGYGGLEIHDNCVMSTCSKIYTLTNTHMDPKSPNTVVSIMPYEQAPFLLSPVVLHSNVWLGIGVIIMPSVILGKNSFCVSNSLVLKSFNENSYISGQPATRIRNRFDNYRSDLL